MNIPPAARTGPVDMGAYQGWPFDLDGVLTKTADVHAAAWKQAFDEFLDNEATLSHSVYLPFDPVADYRRYVDGEPRADDVRNFLAARDIRLPEGTEDDPSDARAVAGLGNRKNELVLEVLRVDGVQVYAGALALVKALRAQGTLLAVVSASENTDAALDAGGIADLFGTRIDGHVIKERTLTGKPAPDSYLEGAKALGVAAGRAVVVEASRAGHFGRVIGADHHERAYELRPHGADVMVTDLTELLRPSASE